MKLPKNHGTLAIIAALSFSLLLSAISCAGKNEKDSGKDLTIWTYDSFNSEWGPGPTVSKDFEEKTGIRITWVSHGDAGGVVSRLLQEGGNSGADIILGLDQNLSSRVLNSGLLEAYQPAGAGQILPELILDKEFRLIPVDYSYFAIVYDSDKLQIPPRSLDELLNPVYQENLILIDPRTSSVGLGFFGWVKEIYGQQWQEYWKQLRPSVLVIAEGWSSAYGLFTSGEAPMVLSYTTSPGYHL